MPKLTAQIPDQNYERVRDAIAAILTVELANQFQTYGLEPGLHVQVFTERVQPLDITEIPAVVVYLAEGKYDNKDAEQSDGSYQYFIDCYAKAKTAENGIRGDQKSSLRLQKIMGMVRAILEHPEYSRLGFDEPLIERTWVSQIGIADNTKNGDTENSTHGRVVFNVEMPEYVELKEPPVIVGMGTQVKLYETDKGYLWGSDIDAPNFIEEEDTEEDGAENTYYFIAESGDFMNNLVRFSELDNGSVTSAAAFVGIFKQEDNTYKNVLFTPEDLATFINAGSTKKKITVATTGTSLTDEFFASNSIMELVMNGQTYVEGMDFTQDGDTITGVTITFVEGWVVIAKI